MTQLDGPSRSIPTSSTPPWRWSMRWWAWPLVLVLLAGSIAVQVSGWQVIAFGFASCGTLDVGDKHIGQLAAVGLCGIVAVMWLVAVLISRFRVPVVAAGAISTAVGLVIVVIALQPEIWTNGYCF